MPLSCVAPPVPHLFCFFGAPPSTYHPPLSIAPQHPPVLDVSIQLCYDVLLHDFCPNLAASVIAVAVPLALIDAHLLSAREWPDVEPQPHQHSHHNIHRPIFQPRKYAPLFHAILWTS